MAKAKSKPLSFSTTMRNPNRIAGFLSQIVEFEGQILTSEIIYKVVHNVIKNKLYYYGMQDTGVSMYIYLKYGDFRYLWWALIGHEIYTIKKMIKRIFRKYNLPLNYIWYGLKGNLKGWFVCKKNYKKIKRGQDEKYF